VSVVKINVITVPEERAEMLEQRFAARAGEVEHVDGFESFDLLRPTGGTDRYLVVTKWRDDAAFEAWMNSESFQRGHAQSGGGAPTGGPPASGEAGSGGHPGSAGGHPGADGEGHPQAAGHPGGDGPPAGGERPAATGAELWAFEVVTSATGNKP
jgi:heme oxygenase (mycobilin-producing)